MTDVTTTLGADHVLFETDFPHPTCTYSDGLAYAAGALADVDDGVRRRILGGNATQLYRIDLPARP